MRAATCSYCGNLYDRPSIGYCSQEHADIDRLWLEAPGHKSWNEMQAVRTRLSWWDRRTGDPQNVRAPDSGAAYRRWLAYCTHGPAA